MKTMNCLNSIQQKSGEDEIVTKLLEDYERLRQSERERLEHQRDRKRTYREKVKKRKKDDQKKLQQPSANTRKGSKIIMIDYVIDDFLRENVIKIEDIEKRRDMMKGRIRTVSPYSCNKKKIRCYQVALLQTHVVNELCS